MVKIHNFYGQNICSADYSVSLLSILLMWKKIRNQIFCTLQCLHQDLKVRKLSIFSILLDVKIQIKSYSQLQLPEYLVSVYSAWDIYHFGEAMVSNKHMLGKYLSFPSLVSIFHYSFFHLSPPCLLQHAFFLLRFRRALHSGVCSTRPGSGTSLLLQLSLTSVIVIEYAKEGLKH